MRRHKLRSRHQLQRLALAILQLVNKSFLPLFTSLLATFQYGIAAQVYDRDIAITVLAVFFLTCCK